MASSSRGSGAGFRGLPSRWLSAFAPESKLETTETAPNPSFSCFAVCHPLQSRKRPASSSLSCSTRSCSSSVRRPSNSALGIVHIRTRCSLSGFAWPRAVAQSWVSRTAPCRGGHIDHGCILPLPESAKMAMCPCSATSEIATA